MKNKKTSSQVKDKVVKETAKIQRLIPTQKRSKERYELILSTAAELISEKGSETFTMSDIVERAGVPHGSLYQYFPDKVAVIGTLAERYNLEGRACVEAELANVKNQRELHAALLRITDGYYEMFLSQPLMIHIWHATQSDPLLQELDADDVNALAELLAKVILKLKPEHDSHQVLMTSTLIMQLIATAVRHAIGLDPKDAKMILGAFKQIFPKNLSVLLDNGM